MNLFAKELKSHLLYNIDMHSIVQQKYTFYTLILSMLRIDQLEFSWQVDFKSLYTLWLSFHKYDYKDFSNVDPDLKLGKTFFLFGSNPVLLQIRMLLYNSFNVEESFLIKL